MTVEKSRLHSFRYWGAGFLGQVLMRRRRTKAEAAELIERFLENRLTHQQEWNDFVECREPDAVVDSYRKRCYDLDPLVNRPDPVDEDAVAQLRGILFELRSASPD